MKNMSEKERKYLNKLASDILFVYKTRKFYNVEIVNNPTYELKMQQAQAYTQKAIDLYDEGIITYSETIEMLCGTLYDGEYLGVYGLAED